MEKKKSGCLSKVLMVFGALFILIILIAVLGGNSDNEPKKVSDSKAVKETGESKKTEKKSKKSDIDENETEKEKLFRKGETAEMNDVRVTMTSCQLGHGSEFNKPAEGNAFLLVEFEIENNSDKELAISSMLSFEAYADDYALDYSLTALMAKEGKQLDGTIAPGKKMKGWIGWEVPEDFSKAEIHFTDNVWSSNKFIFLIER